jgi:PTH1 family peptidyl-tRNA hydrolase
VGLGNPGKKYEFTRHNAGFLVIDRLAKRMGTRVTKGFKESLIGEGQLAGERVILVKPQTYMNLSGLAVRSLTAFYKLSPSDVVVVYDDLDLLPGRIKVRPGGGAAGHKGMKSIIEHLGTEEIARVRVGIGRPPGETVDFVLTPFPAAEAVVMREAFDRAADAVEAALSEGVDKAMSRFNATGNAGEGQ